MSTTPLNHALQRTRPSRPGCNRTPSRAGSLSLGLGIMIATRKAFTVILASAALLLTGCSAARPLHRSEAGIRASLLKRTPPGTPKQDVETYIAREGWLPLNRTQVPTG